MRLIIAMKDFGLAQLMLTMVAIIVVGTIIVAIRWVLLFYKARWKCSYLVCFYALMIVLFLWMLMPFALRNSYPRTLVVLMQESVDTVETKSQLSPLRGDKAGTVVAEKHEERTEHKRSRAPAVFVLAFACLLYAVIFGIVMWAIFKLARQYKRDKVLKESMANIIGIIEQLGDDAMVKEYQKKILDKYMSVWLEEQEE